MINGHECMRNAGAIPPSVRVRSNSNAPGRMLRPIITFSVLALVCVPLLAIGGALHGLGRLFIKPACWLGNKLGSHTTKDMS